MVYVTSKTTNKALLNDQDLTKLKRNVNKIKVLNLYAGIGGNRKLWPNDKIEVTAVEINPEIAKIYKDFFPNDRVIVTDAHKFLLEHYKEFDFIWSSPPCPTHSRVRFMGTKSKHPTCGTIIEKKYPDMNLYQEIIFLTHYFTGKWVVENVIGYYNPLIKPFKFRKHYYWANFVIDGKNNAYRGHNSKIKEMEKHKGFDLSGYKLKHRKDVILRNCVEPKAGLSIFNMAFNDKQQTLGDLK